METKRNWYWIIDEMERAGHYLKRAFIEAANVVVLNQARMTGSHAVRLYRKVKANKGHGKAVEAIARHPAGSTPELTTGHCYV